MVWYILNTKQIFDLYKNFFFQHSKAIILCLNNIFIELLWKLDCQYEKIWKRKIHDGNIRLPHSLITYLFGNKSYGNIWIFLIKNRNGGKIKKKKLLKESDLRRLSQIIAIFLSPKNFFFVENYKHLLLCNVYLMSLWMRGKNTRAKQNSNSPTN